MGNSITMSAQPIDILKNNNSLIEEIEKAITHWHPQGLIIGLPLTADGAEQPSSQQARLFACSLETFHLPTFLKFEVVTINGPKF